MPAAAKRNRAEDNEAATAKILADIAVRMRRGWPTVKNADGAEALKAMAAAHKGAHDDAGIEWWYINGHAPAKNLSFYAAFFRVAVNHTKLDAGRPSDGGSAQRAHTVMAGFTDLKTNEYFSFSALDSASAECVHERIKLGTMHMPDEHLKKALLEMTSGSNARLPEPDEPMQGSGQFFEGADGNLLLDFAGQQLELRPDGSFRVTLKVDARHTRSDGTVAADRVPVSLHVNMEPTKAPVLHGDNGIVAMGDGDDHNDMYYYFVPRCTAAGSMQLAGRPRVEFTASEGQAWLDHEFGGSVLESKAELVALQRYVARKGAASDMKWEWAALQLDNDTEVSVTRVITAASGSEQVFGVIREGTSPAYRLTGSDVVLTAVDGSTWTSPETGMTFPSVYKCTLTGLPRGGKADIMMTAAVKHQETVTFAAAPSFVEGHAAISGTWRGKKVGGEAFIEVNRAKAAGGADDANVGEQLFKATQLMLVEPALTAMQAIEPPSWANVETLAAAGEPAMALFASMAEKSPGPKLQPEQKAIMLRVIAAVSVIRRSGGKTATISGVERSFNNFWQNEVCALMPCTTARLTLRAWSLRLLAEAKAEATGSGDAAVASDDAASPATEGRDAQTTSPGAELRAATGAFVTSTWENLSAAAPAAAVKELKRVVDTRTYKMDTAASDSINDVLYAQGVGLVIRQLTLRLTPTIKFEVHPTVCDCHIKTRVSSENRPAPLDGSTRVAFSSGRGELSTRVALQDGGRTLYTITYVPPDQTVAVEHKWVRAIEVDADGVAHALVEHYRYDPDGVENENSVICTRRFNLVE